MFIIALLVDLSIGKFLNKENNKKEIGESISQSVEKVNFKKYFAIFNK